MALYSTRLQLSTVSVINVASHGPTVYSFISTTGVTESVYIAVYADYSSTGLSNLCQMAGRNYFFLKLAGQYTNNILLD